jgi:hypothetical protein
MHTGEKAQRHRNQRLIGVDRVDQQQNFQFTPEQQESSSRITFEGLEIKTSQGGYSIPLRTSMEYYFLVSTQWLHGLIAGREGCFDPTYPFFAFHKRGLEAVMVRVFFLLAMTDMLSHKRATPLPWDIIWRYLLRIAATSKTMALRRSRCAPVRVWQRSPRNTFRSIRCRRCTTLFLGMFPALGSSVARTSQGRQHQGRRRFFLCSRRKIQLGSSIIILDRAQSLAPCGAHCAASVIQAGP